MVGTHFRKMGSQRGRKRDEPEGDKNGVLVTRVWEDGTKKVTGEPQEKCRDLNQAWKQGFGAGICMEYSGWDRI